jgi:Flp pilus assembly protein CpaB
MARIKHISVTVKYQVGLGGFDMPEDVYAEICKAMKKDKDINFQSSEYPNAAEWLNNNIKERDCFDWESKIDDLND